MSEKHQSNLKNQPQCEARSKRTGEQCRQPKMKNKRVCRFHGGKSTGPKTKEGRERIREANLRHGRYSNKSAELKLEIERTQETRKLIKQMEKAASLELEKCKALRPYIDAYRTVERQEEFELINLFVFGRLNEQIRANPILRQLLTEFFNLLYQNNGLDAFTALLSLFDESLRNRLGLSKSEWRLRSPELKQDAYMDALLLQWVKIQDELSKSD